MRVSIPPKTYPNQFALDNSIGEFSICFEEVRCDALMEECDVQGIFHFQELLVELEIKIGTNLEMACLVEMQRKQTCVF